MSPRVIKHKSIIVLLFCSYYLQTFIPRVQCYWEDEFNEKLSLKKPCEKSEDCEDAAAFCGATNICSCNFGYAVIKHDERLVCRTKTCKKHKECLELYGGNVFCENSHCSCPLGYVFQGKKCLTLHQQIGEDCNSSFSRAPFTACDRSNKLVCQIGTRQVNNVACVAMACHNSDTCRQYTDNSECYHEIVSCKCKQGYHADSTKTVCVPGKRRFDTCIFNNECGKNAVCASRRCVCKSGFRPSELDSADCHLIVCREHKDCTAMDTNTYCTHKSPRNNTCVCKSNHLLDQSTQYCIDHERPSHHFPPLANFLIGTLFALLFLMTILLLFSVRRHIFKYF